MFVMLGLCAQQSCVLALSSNLCRRSLVSFLAESTIAVCTVDASFAQDLSRLLKPATEDQPQIPLPTSRTSSSSIPDDGKAVITEGTVS